MDLTSRFMDVSVTFKYLTSSVRIEATMRADRLLSMLLLLQSRAKMTATELAERLEVSVRTVYRDLDALSAAGVPVYAERGPSGGCVLRPGYRTDLTGLKASEAASLLAAATSKTLDAIGLGRELRQALVKLEAAVGAPTRDEVERVRTRVHIDPTAWFVPEERTPHLAALRDAVLNDHKVKLTYRRIDGSAATRAVEPLGLVAKGGVWYLVALSAGAMRVFRVSRIRKLIVSRTQFARPRRFELGAFWRRWSGDFVAGIPQYWVTLRVPRRALGLLPQVFGERGRAAIEAAQPCGSRDVTVRMAFDSPEAACGSVLSAGVAVEVLDPKPLRAALHASATAVARLYSITR
jgi:predicted DNA-binding transcriptional regulator YafY